MGRLERRRRRPRSLFAGLAARDRRDEGRAGGRDGGVSGRRLDGAALRGAAAAPDARARRRDDGGGRDGLLRRALDGAGLPAARPRRAQGEPARPGRRDGCERAHRAPARRDARELRGRRDDRRDDRRPARGALRAPARAGNEGLEGRGAQGRPLLRARDDGDPHPRADPGQAGGRSRGAEPRTPHGHARGHLRRPARLREPSLRLARQGHLRERRLDRPRAHAAPPHRGHDRIGQVGLHQHPADVDPAPRDARRRADDPDRPEADRAELLRVDPAPPDARRLEPEGGLGGPPQRRRGDGAALRAALARPRPEPARGKPRLPGAGRASRCRISSW